MDGSSIPTLITGSFNNLPDVEKEHLISFFGGIFPASQVPHHHFYSRRRKRSDKERINYNQFHLLDRKITLQHNFTVYLLHRISDELPSSSHSKNHPSLPSKIESSEDYLKVIRDLLHLVRDHIPQLSEEFVQSYSQRSKQDSPFNHYDPSKVLGTIFTSLHNLVR